jgi:hypothetical protein
MAAHKNLDIPQSEVPGVGFVKSTGQWRVQFCRQGRQYSRFFATKQEAENEQPAFLASLPPKGKERA